jgi:SAM-dependent methyltransferase
MSRDVLLYGLSQSDWYAQLIAWKLRTPDLHDFPAPDAHRCQLEHWVWMNREALGRDILDVGVYIPRRYLGDGYVTFGENGEDKKGDLLAMSFPEASFDGVVVTEVLEHCTDPMQAMREVFRVLKPGGLVLVTSPYFWPEHGIDGEYRDYWRFTRHGWELLLKDFTDVSITPCEWTEEGAAAYDVMRRFECMGFASQTQATTGYLCSGRKP